MAWDGSDCSTAALQAAIPLLKRAREVIVIEIRDGSTKTPIEEAATYLSRHGIKPVIRQVQPYGAKPGLVLLDEVRSTHVAYLVMGGFGHLRFTEALFGGVTRMMLNESPVPLFLAH